MTAPLNAAALDELARRLRLHALRMANRSKSSHVGSCFSLADILAVLYGAVLRVDPARPDWPARDRLIVSKGHGAAIVYAALAERGFFDLATLDSFCADGSDLAGHVVAKIPGVELSTGSLGHGLAVATGMALAARRANLAHRVFVVMSDGECDEGSVWESALFAPQHGLDNLTVIIDCNGIQSLGRTAEVVDLEPFAAKWRAFRWDTVDVDGHDVAALYDALAGGEAGRPRCVIARTTTGRGVSFMENSVLWHYRSPQGEEMTAAEQELRG
jgi:transketolase